MNNPLLWSADICLFNTDGPVGYEIRQVESRRDGGKRSYVNHAALVVKPGPALGTVDGAGCQILDALMPKVTINPLEKYRGDLVAVYRATNLTSQQRLDIVEFAVGKYKGEEYPWWDIGLQLLGLQGLIRVDGHAYCSYSVAVPYQVVAGKTFGVEGKAATPDDLWDFVRGEQEGQREKPYECVVRFGILGDE